MNLSVIKIGIAESYPLFRKSITNTLADLPNCNIAYEANSGSELLAQISNESIPNICILGLRMDGMSGFDTIKSLKKHYPETRVLVISIYEHEYCISKAFVSGANGYLPKNCTQEDIQDAISHLIANSYYYANEAVREIAAPDGIKKFISLSSREETILQHLCTDMSFEEIASLEYISKHTVYDHVKSISKKLKIKSRAGLALFAIRCGIAV